MSPTEPNVIGIGRACRLIREEVTIGSNVSEYSSSCSARVRFVRCTRTPHNQPYRGAVLNSATVLSGLYDHGLLIRSIHFNWSGPGLITKGGLIKVGLH